MEFTNRGAFEYVIEDIVYNNTKSFISFIKDRIYLVTNDHISLDKVSEVIESYPYDSKQFIPTYQKILDAHDGTRTFCDGIISLTYHDGTNDYTLTILCIDGD